MIGELASRQHGVVSLQQLRGRDRVLATEGIQVARVTWPDVDDGLVAQVRRILSRR